MSKQSDDKDDLIHPLARPFLWLESKWCRNSIMYIAGVLAVILGLVDMIYPRHEHVDIANIPGFYAAAGFIAFVLAVMGGWFVIRGLLGRDEDYWDKDEKDD